MAVTRTSPGNWTGIVSDQYMVGKVPSGGYLTALATKCVVGELFEASQDPLPKGSKKRLPNSSHTDVLSVNVHFMASTMPGDFTCIVEILKSGRSISTVQASLFQNSKETIRVLCTCGDLIAAEKKGPNLKSLSIECGGTPPDLPPMNQCMRMDAGDNTPSSVRSRVLCLVPQASAVRYYGSRATNSDGSFDEDALRQRESAVLNPLADYSGYMMFADGTEPSLDASPVYLDAGIPPILGAYVTGWVPSINWTVQTMKHPAAGPLKFRFRTRRVVGGFLEEDGELWDSAGDLIAVSRQLALVGVSQASKGKL